jgi:hypothetical protein
VARQSIEHIIMLVIEFQSYAICIIIVSDEIRTVSELDTQSVYYKYNSRRITQCWRVVTSNGVVDRLKKEIRRVRYASERCSVRKLVGMMIYSFTGAMQKTQINL